MINCNNTFKEDNQYDIEIAKRSGHLWKCRSRSSLRQGYLYEFEAKKLDEDPIKLIDKIFPAIEAPPARFTEFANWIPLKARNYHEEGDFQDYILAFLGYSYDVANQLLYLPDSSAITHGWQELQVKYPTLPSIEIIDSSGIAGDVEFFQAFIQSKVILSDSIEFVHDSLYHVSTRIRLIASCIFSKLDYHVEMKRIYNLLEGRFQKIEQAQNEYLNTERMSKRVSKKLEMLQFGLSAIVDYFSLISDHISDLSRFNNKFIEEFFKDIWERPDWKMYLQKRFNDTPIVSQKEIQLFWNDVCTPDLKV